MKKFVLTVAILAIFASPSFAQINAFGLYADDQALSCNITAPIAVVFTIYVYQHTENGATGAQFKVIPPAGVTPVGSETGNPIFLSIGEPYTDLSLAYTSCLPGSFLIWKLNFFTVSPVPDCTYTSIVPAPGKPYPITVNCDFAELSSYPGQGILSPTASCDCNVGTEQSTWGKVKSLYR